MAAAVVEPVDRLHREDHPKDEKTDQKELFIKALRLNCSILLKRKSAMPRDVQKGVDSLDTTMTLKQLLFASRDLLTEIPLPKIWMMVRYPSLASYAERLLEGAESLILAKQIADGLLKNAESKKEMAEVLWMLLSLSDLEDNDRYRSLETIITDVLYPKEQVFTCCDVNKCSEWPKRKTDYKQPEADPNPELYARFLKAATNADWPVFYSCIEEGAKVTGSPLKAKVLSMTKTPESEEKTLTGSSPLHTALSTGQFSLPKLAKFIDFDEDLANFVDDTGNPVLHVAALYDKGNMENVRFLLRHAADVNAVDSEGNTVLQYLVNQWLSLRGGNINMFIDKCAGWTDGDSDRYINAMMTLITESFQNGQKIAWRAARDGWTVLHVLCAMGAHQHILACEKHGADPQELRQGLTLIDTVIGKDRLLSSREMVTLEVLLKDLNLGTFHDEAVRRRTEDEDSESTDKYPLTRKIEPRGEIDSQILMKRYKNEALGKEKQLEACNDHGF